MIIVYTADGLTHEFRDATSRVSDGVLVVTKNPRSYVSEYIYFPLVNVSRWEDVD